MKIVIVMPAYNEESTVGSAVTEAKKYGRVIVVNDASTDRTAAEARKNGAVVVTHSTNKGLGSSLRTGFEKALRMGAEAVITIDADGQHSPEDIPKFIKKLKQGYEFVLGQRDLSRYPFTKRLGNFFLNIATNFVSGTSLKDTESGFRAIKASALRRMYIKSERYEIAVEIVFEAGKHRLKAANVPIRSPVYVKGVGVWDGVKNFKYLLSRRKRNLKSYMDDFRYVMKNLLTG